MTSQQTADRRQPGHAEGGPERLATVVVGAGQAGLATAYHLRRAGVGCVVLDAHRRVGDQWRHRYDSLLLNTPARYDGLPGLSFPAPRGSYPTAADLGEFLETYAATMDIPVRTGVTVHEVRRGGGGRWCLTTSAGPIAADHVVIACGGASRPAVPALAERLDPGIRQVHSGAYRNPGQLLPGPVLVVGCGQSGADIALELRRAGRETWLSGRPRPEIPFPHGSLRLRLAMPVLWFLANHVLTTRTPIGRRMQPAVRRGGAPLERVKRADLDAAGVRRTDARTTDVRDGRPVLADGTVLDVANVVWSTGYRPDFGFVHPDVTGDDGFPRGDGVTVPGAPGLHFVGLIFQTAFASMLIGGTGRDARRVAAGIAAAARRAA